MLRHGAAWIDVHAEAPGIVDAPMSRESKEASCRVDIETNAIDTLGL